MNIAGKFKGALKDLAAAGLNAMPDRFNLFGRYLTGLGGHNLQFDPSTENALVRATERQQFSQIPLTPAEIEDSRRTLQQSGLEEVAPMTSYSMPQAGPFQPGSGPVNPYGGSASSFTPDRTVSQTLGRFNAQVTPQGVRVLDTYDMKNESEDPDLVSGKFQPRKALEELRSIWDPTAGHLGLTVPAPENMTRYSRENINRQGQSPTASPATALGRSLLYALPFKPKAFPIDYTINR